MTAPAAAALLGAAAGLGIVLACCGLRGTTGPERRWPLPLLAARIRAGASLPRTAGALLAAGIVAVSTRWPAGTVLAALAAWYLPPMLGPDRDHARTTERIEAIANEFRGVERSFAVLAGKELRVLVKPDEISDDEAQIMARQIAKRLHGEGSYSGRVKVVVLRETRSVEYAK